MSPAVIRQVWASSRSTSAPRWASSSPIKRMSLRSGTFSITHGSAVRRVAAKMGRAAFFAPLISTVPPRGLPPLIRTTSISAVRRDNPGKSVNHPGAIHRRRPADSPAAWAARFCSTSADAHDHSSPAVLHRARNRCRLGAPAPCEESALLFCQFQITTSPSRPLSPPDWRPLAHGE